MWRLHIQRVHSDVVVIKHRHTVHLTHTIHLGRRHTCVCKSQSLMSKIMHLFDVSVWKFEAYYIVSLFVRTYVSVFLFINHLCVFVYACLPTRLTSLKTGTLISTPHSNQIG